MSGSDADHLARELVVRSTLAGMEGEAAARLAASLTPLEVPAGEILYDVGDAPDSYYFVTEGSLALEADGEAPWVFGPRSLVGINDMMIGRPRARRCRVIEHARLLVARANVWFDLLDDDPVLARGAIANIAGLLVKFWLELGPEVPPARLEHSVAPQLPLPLYEKILILRDSALLKNAGMQATASLAQVAEELRLEAGQVLFEPGVERDTLYLVASGVIELTHQSSAFTTLCGPTSVVGGAMALARQLSSYSARAREQAVLLRIRDEDFFDQAEEHSDLTRAALAYLVMEREPLMRLKPPRP